MNLFMSRIAEYNIHVVEQISTSTTKGSDKNNEFIFFQANIIKMSPRKNVGKN